MTNESIIQEQARRLSRAIAERKEKEILGAWQAGYDYLYVVTDRDNPNRMLFYPTNHEGFPSKHHLLVERYDLWDVSAEQVQEYR